MGKESLFVQRKSKLGARHFVEALLISCLSKETVTLGSMCTLLKKRGIRISTQGVHQRFNHEAVTLMEGVFREALESFQTEHFNCVSLLKPFSAVQMIDSSGISLPSRLKGLYKGFGGSASEAGLKLQVLFDYLNGEINDIHITPGCRNDQSFDEHIESIQEGALFLQDLGYFKVKSFVKIEEKKAYFVSRHFSTTHIYDADGILINLAQKLRDIASVTYSQRVCLGSKEKLPVRLIATRLSEEEAQKRITQIKRSHQKKGKKPKKETLELAYWSIYITNIPVDWIPDNHIHLLYSVRWQIELFFKLCKSEAGIDVINGKNSPRVLCELYAKLICVVQLLYLCSPMRWGKTSELSFYKAFKQFKIEALEWFKASLSSYRLKQFFRSFFDDLNDFAFKDKHRKKRRLTIQQLMDATQQESLYDCIFP